MDPRDRSDDQVCAYLRGHADDFVRVYACGGDGTLCETANGVWESGSRECAVGGDSGHPCFTSLDGTHLVLLGCYSTAPGVAKPGTEWTRPIIEQAVQSMGGDPSVLQWESFADYPVYLGPVLNMGGYSSVQADSDDNDEPGE